MTATGLIIAYLFGLCAIAENQSLLTGMGSPARFSFYCVAVVAGATLFVAGIATMLWSVAP